MSSPRLEASPPPAAARSASIARDFSSDSDQDAAVLSDDEQEEEEDMAPSDSEDEGPAPSRRRPRIHFNVQQLQTVYHLPLKTAAERLGVCEAALKRICRRNRIHKWPYRQLTSVRRRIADLKERRAASLLEVREFESSDVNDPLRSFTTEAFDASLRRLKEEQDQIILSAHQSRRPRMSTPPRVASSLQLQPPQQQETLSVHGFRSKIADLPPLDLRRVDRDFPLLFLANVCESVRAYH